MSTFDGLVREFPNIRIDYFRNYADKPVPAALFLSHVHSDHLLGLESVKMPFVYCSATTKRILLKMEKYPHRINFAKGILEKRKQHFKHLKSILRAIPLNTATKIELSPKSTIQVTLLDANHCPGAVMFLIEGDGKAILYTGDVRAEAWWVNSIVQNPVLLPYTCGLRRLDCVYLDTTFATHDEPYKVFPGKADGLKELLEQVGRCPSDTIFYFRAWTFGYEQVWLALSNFLQSQVHVNEYQLRLFHDGGDGESAALAGFEFGNQQMPGCLTLDTNARIHSCEPGLECHFNIRKMKNVVWISPIISRLKDGTEIRELGAGGGWKDLYPSAQLKLEDSVTIPHLLSLFTAATTDEETNIKLAQELGRFGNAQDLFVALDACDEIKVEDDNSIKLKELVAVLSKGNIKTEPALLQLGAANSTREAPTIQNHSIHFPFSRHSSYSELRHLVGVFKPKDICPCTVSPEAWSKDLSMQALFGDLCSEQTFYFDQQTRELVAEVEERKGFGIGARGKRKRDDYDDDSQMTESQDNRYHETSSPVVFTSPIKDDSPEYKIPHRKNVEPLGDSQDYPSLEVKHTDRAVEECGSQLLSSSAFDSQPGGHWDPGGESLESNVEAGDPEFDWNAPDLESVKRKQARMAAYNAARAAILANDRTEWDAVPLRSVGREGHTEEELEL